MKITMFTNTFLLIVGGVARSVETLARGLERFGHHVLVIAPECDEAVSDSEFDVIRLPAVQHFNGSDFSAPVPVTAALRHRIEDFGPDLIHSYHPFLLGGTALRVASSMDVPVVFTHHTRYEL